MAFTGSLIRVGGDNFPLTFVFKESYKIAPNRRQDLDSTRNASGYLERNVLDHTASTISFTTVPMNNIKLNQMMAWVRSHYVSEKEKKIALTYYCPDIDDYKTGIFYVPDIEFPIRMVDLDHNIIEYNSFTLEFIEY